jgi:tetratricopeptide (TPR) repeat protein
METPEELAYEHRRFAAAQEDALMTALDAGDRFTARQAAEALLPRGEGHHGLALVHYASGHLPEALSSLEAARLRYVGEEHMVAANTMDIFRGLILLEQGKADAAMTALEQAEDEYARLPGLRPLWTANVRSRRLDLERFAGRLVEPAKDASADDGLDPPDPGAG